MGDIKGKNKNGTGSYSFDPTNYNDCMCGLGCKLGDEIPQGNEYFDAATANLGAPYKMPTKDQAQEMLDGTISEWTSINGVNGRKLTSKTDSNKYIFFPAAGRWNNNSNEEATKYAYGWTTTKRGSYYGDSALSIFFFYNRSEISPFQYRFFGQPVRPIR